MKSRDLDKLVAEKIFNWTDIELTKATDRRHPLTEADELTGKDPNSNRPYRHYLLHYSTNPAHSAEVLGFCKQSWSVRFERPKYSNLWVCILTKEEGSPTIHVEDELGPRAICIAALRSVGVDYKD